MVDTDDDSKPATKPAAKKATLAKKKATLAKKLGKAKTKAKASGKTNKNQKAKTNLGPPKTITAAKRIANNHADPPDYLYYSNSEYSNDADVIANGSRMKPKK